MTRARFLVLLLPLVACGPIPQSTAEFREQYRSGPPRGGAKEERTIDRPLQRVLADVRANADKCFNVVTDHTGPSSAGFGQARMRITYRSTTTGSSSSGELVVRMVVPGAGRQPQGGYYALLGDMQAVSPTKTRLTVNGSNGSGWVKPIEAVIAWASGQALGCPEMP
jgi:hypothetical protein